MGDLLDAIKDTILGFKYVVGFGVEENLLLRIGIILMIAIPFGLFLMAILTLTSNRLDKPTPTKQQQIETLRKAANHIGSRVERAYLGKTKIYRQFERLVKMADSPFGLNAREWFLFIVGTGLVVSIMVMMQSLIDWYIYKIYSIPLFSLFFYPTGAMASLYFFINSKAKKRAYILQYDFIRAFNRLGDLHNETSYRMLQVSLAGTRLLKNYLPRVDLFKSDPKEAMERFVNEIGMEEAILFKNTILRESIYKRIQTYQK